MEKKLAVLKVEFETYDRCIDNYALSSHIVAIGEIEALKNRVTKAINCSWDSRLETVNEYAYTTTFQLEDVVKEDPWHEEYFKDLLENNDYVDPETGEHIKTYRDFMCYIRVYPVVE